MYDSIHTLFFPPFFSLFFSSFFFPPPYFLVIYSESETLEFQYFLPPCCDLLCVLFHLNLHRSVSFTREIKSPCVQLQEVPCYLYLASTITAWTPEELLSLWPYFCPSIFLNRPHFFIYNLICLSSASTLQLVPSVGAWEKRQSNVFWSGGWTVCYF